MVKGKGGEQRGCGILRVCGEWIWLGEGWDGWGVLFVGGKGGGKDRGLWEGAWDGREWLFWR